MLSATFQSEIPHSLAMALQMASLCLQYTIPSFLWSTLFAANIMASSLMSLSCRFLQALEDLFRTNSSAITFHAVESRLCSINILSSAEDQATDLRSLSEPWLAAWNFMGNLVFVLLLLAIAAVLACARRCYRAASSVEVTELPERRLWTWIGWRSRSE